MIQHVSPATEAPVMGETRISMRHETITRGMPLIQVLYAGTLCSRPARWCLLSFIRPLFPVRGWESHHAHDCFGFRVRRVFDAAAAETKSRCKQSIAYGYNLDACLAPYPCAAVTRSRLSSKFHLPSGHSATFLYPTLILRYRQAYWF